MMYATGLLISLTAGSVIAGCDTSDVQFDGGGDDSLAIQAEIERLHRAGGGHLRLAAGKVYRCRSAPIVLEAVTLDLNGSTLELILTNTNDQGVRLRSRATLCNGVIRVVSRGKPSLQAGVHAPVCIGPLYGEGGKPNQVSADEGVTGWVVRDLTLSSDKNVMTPAGAVGAVAIQVTGGATHGLIERITVPNSETLSGGVHLDWGTLGPIVSAEDPVGLETNRRVFRAGQGHTTHPRQIIIRDITIGRLTGGKGGADGGADAIRLSGCQNVTVSRVRAAATSGVFLRHTAGDLGLEFAPVSMGRTLSGNRFTNCAVDDCLDGRLFVSDSYGDNLARGVARGYRASSTPLLPTDVLFENITGAGNDNSVGGLFVQQNGGGAVNCHASHFSTGFMCDADVEGVTLTRCVAHDNRDAGFWVEHVAHPPRNCRLIGAMAMNNGAGQRNGANIIVGASQGTIIDGGVIGSLRPTDTARYGIWIKERRDGCIDATITGNPIIRSHASGGAAIRVSSRDGWGALRLFTGARYGTSVKQRWAGLSIVPIAIDSVGHRTYAVLDAASPPHDFPRRAGDIFRPGTM